ncbi:hypothetical protein K9N68_39195 (plasmid) [Kovacikia minuta CCNUW1]|uniref:hypothetical protein n=1 Tax=Kovacikia minuta TaxID=2931930 RepID=UPI001CC9B922|nr:hypothetical protein [Kovacikia minuta]UBF30171.1 hypothetical protein K9N68_39195 [Kovacikia minuta CCNUW1]
MYQLSDCLPDGAKIDQKIRATFLLINQVGNIRYDTKHLNSNSAAFQSLENALPGHRRPQPLPGLWVPAWHINPFTGKASPNAKPLGYKYTDYRGKPKKYPYYE